MQVPVVAVEGVVVEACAEEDTVTATWLAGALEDAVDTETCACVEDV